MSSGSRWYVTETGNLLQNSGDVGGAIILVTLASTRYGH